MKTKGYFKEDDCNKLLNKFQNISGLAVQCFADSLGRTKTDCFALPVFNMERFAGVKFTFSESSFKDIFLLAIMTSKFTTIGIGYTVKSFFRRPMMFILR